MVQYARMKNKPLEEELQQGYQRLIEKMVDDHILVKDIPGMTTLLFVLFGVLITEVLMRYFEGRVFRPGFSWFAGSIILIYNPVTVNFLLGGKVTFMAK